MTDHIFEEIKRYVDALSCELTSQLGRVLAIPDHTRLKKRQLGAQIVAYFLRVPGDSRLEIQCARCKTPSDVDLAAMKHPPTTFVHDLASRLRCRKCAKAGRRPAATLLQLAWQPRHPRPED